MMAIRKPSADEYEILLELAKEAQQLSPYQDIEIDESHTRRLFAMARAAPNMYCRIAVDKDDVPVGIFIGHIAKNILGALVATDLLSYSDLDTHRLLIGFKRWARSKGADKISITEITGIPRYQRLIQACGFHKIGNIYIGD